MSYSTYPTTLPFYEELGNTEFLEKLKSSLPSACTLKKTETVDHPFMAAFEKTANLSLNNNKKDEKALTLDPIIDLYYGIGYLRNIDDRLKKAWDQDPDMTVRIIFYARSIHRGKGMKPSFYRAYSWLLQHHPRTALENIHLLISGTVPSDAKLSHLKQEKKHEVQTQRDGWDFLPKSYELLERRDFKTHGCWKDLGILLTIYCQGELDGPSGVNRSRYLAMHWPRQEYDMLQHRRNYKERRRRYAKRNTMSQEEIEEDISQCQLKSEEDGQIRKIECQKDRHRLRQERFDRVCQLLKDDTTYRALHFTIARIYADQLRKDMDQMMENQRLIEAGKLRGKYAVGFNLSLAAKWAPSLGQSQDKFTFLPTSIAELLFPPDQYQDGSREHYLNKVRGLYRKQYIVPLRNALDCIEHYMQDGFWDKVDFRHTPAICLRNNMKVFFKHAPEHTCKLMERVANGKMKISGDTLTPNQLVYHAEKGPEFSESLEYTFSMAPQLREKYILADKQMVNGQWKTLIESLRNTSILRASESGERPVDLGSCIALCDVSGSMISHKWADKEEDRPFYAAIGLSLVIAHLAKPPFNGKIITFNKNPKILDIKTEDPFTDQVRKVSRSQPGSNVDLEKVVTELLLPMAIKNQLEPKDMIKRIFIFTDMKFDAVSARNEEFTSSVQDSVRRKYNEAGYEVPEIVWWNLSSARNDDLHDKLKAPVTKNDVGVRLVSGYSASMLRSFLDGDDSFGANVEEEEYEVLVLEDDTEEDEKPGSSESKLTLMEQVRKEMYHESFNGVVIVD